MATTLVPCLQAIPKYTTAYYAPNRKTDYRSSVVPEACVKGRDKWLHPTVSVVCNYLSLPLIPASVTTLQMCAVVINKTVVVRYHDWFRDIDMETRSTLLALVGGGGGGGGGSTNPWICTFCYFHLISHTGVSKWQYLHFVLISNLNNSGSLLSFCYIRIHSSTGMKKIFLYIAWCDIYIQSFHEPMWREYRDYITIYVTC